MASSTWARRSLSSAPEGSFGVDARRPRRGPGRSAACSAAAGGLSRIATPDRAGHRAALAGRSQLGTQPGRRSSRSGFRFWDRYDGWGLRGHLAPLGPWTCRASRHGAGSAAAAFRLRLSGQGNGAVTRASEGDLRPGRGRRPPGAPLFSGLGGHRPHSRRRARRRRRRASPWTKRAQCR
jgi:hypothetical protein